MLSEPSLREAQTGVDEKVLSVTSAPPRSLAARFLASASLLLAGAPGCDAPPSDPGPAPSGFHRVTGQAVAIDDTGLPDSPMTDATFVLLPATMEAQVWAGTEADMDEHQLPYLTARLDPAVLAEGTLFETTSRGRFIANVPAGEHLLCRIGDHIELDARWTSGCARVSAAGDATWRVTGGEGGIHVTDAHD